MDAADIETISRLVKDFIDASLTRFRVNGDRQSRFYVKDLTSYNYTIDLKKELGKERLRTETIHNVLSMLYQSYHIRAEYREHIESIHLTVDLKTVAMSIDQANVHAEILKAHRGH